MILALRLVDHYEIRLVDDVPLIKSLRGIDAEPAIAHAKRFGISDAGRRELDRMLGEPTLPNGAKQTSFLFVRDVGVWSHSISRALQAAVLSDNKLLRECAVYTLCRIPDSTETLRALRKTAPQEMLNELVRRQDRGTIEWRLSQISDDVLTASEVPYPEASPLDWISTIRNPAVLKKLVGLRERAIKLGLARLTQILGDTIATLDVSQAATVEARQARFGKPEWQTYLRRGAQQRWQRRLLASALSVEYGEVVDMLQKKDADIRLKLWCEGLTDVGPLVVFLEKIFGKRPDIAVQPIRGWIELPDEYPMERLWDGCSDVVLVADGDNGRDWTKPDHPLTDQGRDLMKRLADVGVTGFILRRYGIENYFTRSAVETVLGPEIGRLFPLNADRGTPAGYSKTQNRRIAEAMNIEDLQRTDLMEILTEIRSRLGALERD